MALRGPSTPMPDTVQTPSSVEEVAAGLREAGYLPGANTALETVREWRSGKAVLVP